MLSVVVCSGMHDSDNSWYVEHEGEGGTAHVGKTLQHSALLLFTQRRSAWSSDHQRYAHGPSQRNGRTFAPDRKDNGGAAILVDDVWSRGRLVSEMR